MISINDPGRRPDERKPRKAMSRLRISLVGLVAVCLASMFMTAVASAEGPFWHVNGAKLKQGSLGVKLQNKGVLRLKGTTGGLTLTVKCGISTSDATIEGQGETKQGQGKGIVKYEQCVTEVAGGGVCTRPETVTTNPLKAHLAQAVNPSQKKLQIVELFEPAPSQQVENPPFATLPFNGCTGTAATLNGITAPVRGSVAATIEPQEVESQEGALWFPPEAEVIKEAIHEGQQVRVELTLGRTPTQAFFTGYYGVLGQTRFSVFRQ